MISRKLRLSGVILLLLLGVLLNRLNYNGIFGLPVSFLASLAIFALVMVVFDESSKFKLKKFGRVSLTALKLTITCFVLNLILLTFFARFVVGIRSIPLALLFAVLVSGTDTSVILSKFGAVKSKIIDVLKMESLLSTLLTVLLPFVLLDVWSGFRAGELAANIFNQVVWLIQHLIIGIGAGVLIGIVVLKIIKKSYSELLSPLAVISAALLSYIISETLGGSGVVAVITFGIFFGNIYIKEKAELTNFSSIFVKFLGIVVFILIGLILGFPLDLTFFLSSLILFVIFLAVRLGSVLFVFKKMNIREKLFITLNARKGLAAAVVIFMLITSIGNICAASLTDSIEILHLALAFIAYSILLSAITLRFSKYFIGVK